MAKKKVPPLNPSNTDIPLYEQELTVRPEHEWMLLALNEFTLEKLKHIYFSLTGIKITKPLNKAFYCKLIAYILSFDTQEQFDSLFSNLPLLVQDAISLTAFTDYSKIADLEKKHGVVLLTKQKNQYYYEALEFDHTLRMDLFVFSNERFLAFYKIFRIVFSRWLPKPPGYFLSTSEPPLGEIWSNAEDLQDSLPLLFTAVPPFIPRNETYSIIKKGFNKTDLKKLRAQTGLKAFPLGTSFGVDPINLVVRVVLALYGTIPKRPADIDEWIRTLIQRFLFEDLDFLKQMKRTDYLCGGLLEHLVLTDHISVVSSHNVPNNFVRPPCREQLKEILTAMMHSGKWFEVETIRASLEAQGIPFTFISESYESWNLTVKGSTLIKGTDTFEDRYSDIFKVAGPVRDSLLRLPLLQAYFYLLAVFGIVEIAEKVPAKPLTRNGKQYQISPYDALTHARITDYGLWCLGASKTKPKRTVEQFEAIADQELLLITFRGKSLERRLYLEQIGERMGDERFRVSEASFIRDCTKKSEIESRIQQFKKLINPQPSPRWEDLFSTVLARSGLFSNPYDCYLFTLPSDPRIKEVFTQDIRLRSLTIRAEGNRLVIYRNDYKRFLKILSEYGFTSPKDIF
ncbi:MAG TPA: hypothetical protein VJ861_12275 [Treponemataceae bacterium]|nr:hypothetical protein [Treponemataceae bacterium]